jgi:hypothetical protein
MQIRHIVFRDHHRRSDRDLRRPAGIDHLVLAAHLGNGLFEHVLVELETDLLDVAGLFLAEQVARAANVEIVAGELEAGAERVERLQHLEPLVCRRRQRLVDRQREQRESTHLGAADTAAQLVELGQAEHVGPVHDQRVGGRHVEAGFHDRRRQQHVILPS